MSYARNLARATSPLMSPPSLVNSDRDNDIPSTEQHRKNPRSGQHSFIHSAHHLAEATRPPSPYLRLNFA